MNEKTNNTEDQTKKSSASNTEDQTKKSSASNTEDQTKKSSASNTEDQTKKSDASDTEDQTKKSDASDTEDQTKKFDASDFVTDLHTAEEYLTTINKLVDQGQPTAVETLVENIICDPVNTGGNNVEFDPEFSKPFLEVMQIAKNENLQAQKIRQAKAVRTEAKLGINLVEAIKAVFTDLEAPTRNFSFKNGEIDFHKTGGSSGSTRSIGSSSTTNRIQKLVGKFDDGEIEANKQSEFIQAILLHKLDFAKRIGLTDVANNSYTANSLKKTFENTSYNPTHSNPLQNSEIRRLFEDAGMNEMELHFAKGIKKYKFNNNDLVLLPDEASEASKADEASEASKADEASEASKANEASEASKANEASEASKASK